MFSDKLIAFYKQLQPPKNLPRGIEVLFPQKDPAVIKVVEVFCKKFFKNNPKRRLMLGINPGRLGAGITGVNFTAPKQLIQNCGITHPFGTSSELSAEFIYEVIDAYGGPKDFYKDWFIGSVCPLGFMKEGINMNYYDDKKLQVAVTPFIIEKIREQLAMGFDSDYCICIGGDKNLKFLTSLNEEYKWFKKIIALPHPRFILQYRRKQKDIFIHQYLSVLRLAD
jgi:Domain of unknown function (DUF4918)